MLQGKYTASLYMNDHETISELGNDVKKLMVKLLSMLESENSYTSGVIRDNYTNEIIHRCRKVASE